MLGKAQLHQNLYLTYAIDSLPKTTKS